MSNKLPDIPYGELKPHAYIRIDSLPIWARKSFHFLTRSHDRSFWTGHMMPFIEFWIERGDSDTCTKEDLQKTLNFIREITKKAGGDIQVDLCE